MVHLNHIGIAVAQPEELKKLFGILGFSLSGTEHVPEQGVLTHFIPLPQGQSSLELLEPTDPSGTVAQFIKKRGVGIHHLSFLVEQGTLESVCQKLKEAGYRLIYSELRRGAHGMKINFIHPASAGGILIELMESGEYD